MCGAAALAKLVNGVVFDEAENRLLSVDDAIAVARKNVRAVFTTGDHNSIGHAPDGHQAIPKPLLRTRDGSCTDRSSWSSSGRFATC